MTIRYSLIIFAISILPGCKMPSADKYVDTVKPAITVDSSQYQIAEPLLLSAFEMRDDSIFKDGSIPVKWENAGFTDVKGFKLFLKQLQLWVRDNNKEELANVIRYPLKNVSSRAQLMQSYDAIFTKPVKLSFATINFSQIFRNSQGAMTESGLVWFRQLGDSFRIIAVNN